MNKCMRYFLAGSSLWPPALPLLVYYCPHSATIRNQVNIIKHNSFFFNEPEYIRKARGLVHYSLRKCWSESAKLFSGFLASHLQVWSTRSPPPTRPAHHHTRCRTHNTHFSDDCLLNTKLVRARNIRKWCFHTQLESFPYSRGTIISSNKYKHKHH